VGHRVRLCLTITGTAILFAVAACGGGNAASPTTAASGATGFQAYAECLRQHGVDLAVPSARPSGLRGSGPRPSDAGRPSGAPGRGFPGAGNQPPPGVDQATWDAAMQACATLRPSAGTGGGPGGRGDNGAANAYRNCLRDHGVTPSNGPNGLPSTDPTVAAAMAACAPLRPTAPPSPAP
jgi:hypothetical protein